MQETYERLWQTVEQERSRYIDLLKHLVRTGKAGEEVVQHHVAQELGQLDCAVTVLEHAPCTLPLELEISSTEIDVSATRTTVIGRKDGIGGRSLLLYAHPDSEPVENVEEWEHPPFEAEIDEGRLYGWGVADDLLGVAAMLSGLSAVLNTDLPLSGDVILASTPSKRHAQGIVAVLDAGVEVDAALYLHPAESGAGLRDIKAFTPGLLRFQITVPGAPPDTNEPVHTPLYHHAINPIDKAWLIYEALHKLAKQRVDEVFHPKLATSAGRSTNLHISYFSSGFADNYSRVASEAVLGGSISFPPTESLPQVQRQIQQVVEQVASDDPWMSEHPPQIKWVIGTTGVEVLEDSKLFQTVSQAITAVTRIKPSAHSLHSASDIRVPMLYKGIPTLGFGSLAGNLVQAGGHDEWVDVDDYIDMVKVVATIIHDWCGDTGANNDASTG